MSKRGPVTPVSAVLAACLMLAVPIQAQVDIERLRGTPFESEPDTLLLLSPEATVEPDSVCEVIGELPTRDVVGRIVEAEGEVFVERLGRRLSQQRRDVIMDDDHVITNDNGYVLIRFNDGALLSLSAKGHMHLYAYWYERSAVVATDDDCAAIELFAGSLRMISGDIAQRDPDRHEILVHTGSQIHRVATRTTESTDLAVEINPTDGSVFAAVYSGAMQISSSQGELSAGTGTDTRFASISTSGTITALP